MLTKALLDIDVMTAPYPHVVLGSALAVHDGLVGDFPPDDRFGRKIRMHGDLTSGDEGYDALIAQSPAFRQLHDWVYSEAFIATFLAMFDQEIERQVRDGDLLIDPRTLPIHAAPYERRKMLGPRQIGEGSAFLFPRLDLGIGKLGYGTDTGGSGVHVDNLTRLVSILVYIDDNPTMVGGEHRLYRLDGIRPVIDRVYAPRGNLMVASLQSNSAFHDVNPVTAITGTRKALYMAVSCSTVIWRPHRDIRLQRLTKNRYRPSKAERAVARLKKAIGR